MSNVLCKVCGHMGIHSAYVIKVSFKLCFHFLLLSYTKHRCHIIIIILLLLLLDKIPQSDKHIA